MTDEARLAAKAFIVDDGDVLAVRRSPDDVQQPGIWELPGGRLELAEPPRQGLHREVREETGLGVTVQEPLTVRHFERDDGQTVTLLCLRATPDSRDVRLSPEHTDHAWLPVDSADEQLNEFFQREIRAYRSVADRS